MSAALEPFEPSMELWSVIATTRPKLFHYLERQKITSFVHTVCPQTNRHQLRVLNTAYFDVPEDVRAECDPQPDHADIAMVFEEGTTE